MAVINTYLTASSGVAFTITSVDKLLYVGPTGAIVNSGGYGVHADYDGTPYDVGVLIEGLVFGSSGGFWLERNGGNLTISETGQIRGGTWGVTVSNSTDIPDLMIDNAGLIVGAFGVFLGNGDDTIINTGTIHSTGPSAVATRAGADKLVNYGEIIGDVDLYAGNDRFVAKAGGTVSGTVNGGAGDDKYWIVDNSLTLADTSGTDKILSKVNHTLGADFENLKLLGSKDLNGTGNGGGNEIAGNTGDNALKGRAGDDVLEGRKGADKLYGGSGDDTLNGGRGKDVYVGGNGNDTFVFSTGSGKDKIRDFNPNTGAEDIDLSAMASITGYSDLTNNHMSQVGFDVVINAGGGDVLTLVGIDIGDLAANDFLF